MNSPPEKKTNHRTLSPKPARKRAAISPSLCCARLCLNPNLVHRATSADSSLFGAPRLPAEIPLPPTEPSSPRAESPRAASPSFFPVLPEERVTYAATYPATWGQAGRIRKFQRRGTSTGYAHAEPGKVLSWSSRDQEAQEQQRRLWLTQQPRLPRSPYGHVERYDQRPIFTPQPAASARSVRDEVRGLMSKGEEARAAFTRIVMHKSPAMGKKLKAGLRSSRSTSTHA